MKVIKGGKDKPKPKTTPRIYDHEAIAKDLAAGMLSIREIGRKHGCSPATVFKVKKKRGIERDLSPRVREKVRAKLVGKKAKVNSKQVNGKQDQEKFETEAIEEAAKEGVKIITRHRRIIEKCTVVANQFLEELKKDKIVAKITDKGKKIYTKIPANQKSALFNSVTIAASRLIPLERLSFNLDDAPAKMPEGEGVLTAFPSGPLTLSEWEKQMKEAEINREKNNTDTGS